jgi:hypothetical protein
MYPNQEPVEALPAPARLSESAVGLARAEIGLGLVHVRDFAVRALTALLATIVASAFAQLAVLLAVLSLLLTHMLPLENLIVAIGRTDFLSLLAACGAVLAWGRVHRTTLRPGERA